LEVLGAGVVEVVSGTGEVVGAAELEAETTDVDVAIEVEGEETTLVSSWDGADSLTTAPFVLEGASEIEVVGKTVELATGSDEEIETTVDSGAEGVSESETGKEGESPFVTRWQAASTSAVHHWFF